MPSSSHELSPTASPSSHRGGAHASRNQSNDGSLQFNAQHAEHNVVNYNNVTRTYINTGGFISRATSGMTIESISSDSKPTSYEFRLKYVQEPEEADQPTAGPAPSEQLLQVSGVALQRLEKCVENVAMLCDEVVARIRKAKRKRNQEKVKHLVNKVQDQKQIADLSFQDLGDRVTTSSTKSAKNVDLDANGRLEKIQFEIESAEGELREVALELDNYIQESKRKPYKAAAYGSIRKRLERAGRHVLRYQAFIDCLPSPATSQHGATPRDFTCLRNASLVTRTFYRRLCKACPLSKFKQGHSHHVRIALLAEKEAPVDEPQAKDDVERSTSSQHYVAIESAFEKNSLVWFHAFSTVQIQQLDGESALVDQDDGTSPQLLPTQLQLKSRTGSNDSSYSSNSSLDLSQSVQVCISSLVQGSNGLAMSIDDKRGGRHQVEYLAGHRRPAKESNEHGRERQTLYSIIDDGSMEYSDQPSFEVSRGLASTRLVVAACIADAALRYSWQEWLDGPWSTEDIFFHCVNGKFEPFLRIEMFDRETSSDNGDKFMSHLGDVLLEVGLWQRIRVRPDDESLLERLEIETNPDYQDVVRKCFNFSAGKSSSVYMDKVVFQKTFYDEVVFPLKKMANHCIEMQRGNVPELEEDDKTFITGQEIKS